MFTGKGKLAKANPDQFEMEIAQEIYNLELSSTDLKADLKDLYILGAKEVELGDGAKKAIVLFVSFKLLSAFHKIQARLVRELEKKMAGRSICVVAQRTILSESYCRSAVSKGPRPRSRTLTAVQDAILEDLVYPTEIVGKRTVFRADGNKVLKVFLDATDQANVEGKLETFELVYSKLTQKRVKFEFPVEN